MSTKACPGVCVAERIADYCDAILNTEDLCKTGLRCCVSSDAYGDKAPPNLIIPNKNSSRSTTSRPQTTSAMYKTTKPIPKPPKPSTKQCNGKCVNIFDAFFCDNINTEAECPDEGTCCENNPVSTTYLANFYIYYISTLSHQNYYVLHLLPQLQAPQRLSRLQKLPPVVQAFVF